MIQILLVDDESQEREGIKFLIDKFKLPLMVAEAANGKSAWEYIKSHEVNILFTDVKMPYMDGLELAKQVNEYNKDIIIIIFSAYGEFEYAKKACAANAVNYLLKPIEIEEFKSVMDKVIGNCVEQKHWREQKESLIQADKKFLLYNLMNGKMLNQNMIEKLKVYDVNLEQKFMSVISIETRSNYFEEKEETFKKIVDQNINLKHEIINLYPNLTYLLVYAGTRFDEIIIEKSMKKIYTDMITTKEEMVSIIVGERFQGISRLIMQVEAVNALREDTFSYFSGILFSSKITMNNEARIEVTNEIKQRIIQSIEDKNIESIKEQIAIYLQKLEEEKSSSALYTKYLLLDVVRELYIKYGIYNDNTIFKTSDNIMKCNDLKGMKCVLDKVIEEVEKAGQNYMPEGNVTVSEIKKIIANEYQKDLNLDEIAGRVFLTPAYLSYIFKKETGCNLIKYLTDYRMEKAKELLEQGQMKIVDIGKACGYQNQPYFNRLFKNYYAVTPKQFREDFHEK